MVELSFVLLVDKLSEVLVDDVGVLTFLGGVSGGNGGVFGPTGCELLLVSLACGLLSLFGFRYCDFCDLLGSGE